MKLYERIENNNFDEIDRNRAIELIEGGNGHLVYNENYFKLQKENKELKADNYELNNRITDLLENIPIQKVKDKIEKEKLPLTIVGGRKNKKTLEEIPWMKNKI